jgi:thioredoxin-related protein
MSYPPKTEKQLNDMKRAEAIFKEYVDLYELTKKTADDHIAFFKNKESVPMKELFAIWKKLSEQAENFDKNDWTVN